MALKVTQSHTRIEKNRNWEDYQSLKKYWNFRGAYLREVLYTGYQTATNSSTEWVQASDDILAFLGANDIVYLKTESDLAGLDGDSVWMDYVNSSGTLYENVETKLDSGTSTATEVPIGCMSGTYVDAVASVSGDVLTMTNLDRTVANDLAGWYVVASGDATDQEGNYLTIESNTAAAPTLITCTTTPNANWAADNVSVQQTLNNDVFRIRRLWAETEAPTDNAYLICDKDESNIYATICDANTNGGAGSRYTATSDRCFIGRVKVYAPTGQQADNEAKGHRLEITFTPKASDYGEDQDPADIMLAFEFNDEFEWQPCMELEAGTDVIFKIKSILNSEDWIDVVLDYAILEVNTD